MGRVLGRRIRGSWRRGIREGLLSFFAGLVIFANFVVNVCGCPLAVSKVRLGPLL